MLEAFSWGLPVACADVEPLLAPAEVHRTPRRPSSRPRIRGPSPRRCGGCWTSGSVTPPPPGQRPAGRAHLGGDRPRLPGRSGLGGGRGPGPMPRSPFVAEAARLCCPAEGWNMSIADRLSGGPTVPLRPGGAVRGRRAAERVDLLPGPVPAGLRGTFRRSCAADTALTTSNGTVALHLVLAAAGIGRGTRCIVPALTYVATANAVGVLRRPCRMRGRPAGELVSRPGSGTRRYRSPYPGGHRRRPVRASGRLRRAPATLRAARSAPGRRRGGVVRRRPRRPTHRPTSPTSPPSRSSATRCSPPARAAA